MVPSAPAPVAPLSLPPSEGFHILQGDFLAFAEQYDGPRFNLLHVDFPYGIGAGEKSGQAATHYVGEYTDKPETFQQLMVGLEKALKRGNLVADSAHIILWLDQREVTMSKVQLGYDKGFKFFPHMLVWFKSDRKGVIADTTRRYRHVYETALFGSRGDRKILRTTPDVAPHPTDTTQHGTAKPQAMLEHFLSPLVDETTRILDPTAGSGTAIAAAKKLGAASGLGIELDEGFVEIARGNLK